MAKNVVAKKPSNTPFFSDKRIICVASLTTALHFTFPLVKVLNKLGSVNLITEDKAYLALTEGYNETYELGNVSIRVVECVSVMEDREVGVADYDYTILDVKDFLPAQVVDKYIFLSNREFYKQQLTTSEHKNTRVYSVFNSAYYDVKRRPIVEKQVLVNESLVRLKQYAMYDQFLFQLMNLRKFNSRVPSDLNQFLCTVLADYQRLTPQNVSQYMLEVEF